jgi:hypothetical protein
MDSPFLEALGAWSTEQLDECYLFLKRVFEKGYKTFKPAFLLTEQQSPSFF